MLGDWNISVENYSWAIFCGQNSIQLHPLKPTAGTENHPFEKDNHLPNPHFLGSTLIFQGVYLPTFGWLWSMYG